MRSGVSGLTRLRPGLNAFTFEFDPALLDEIGSVYRTALAASLGAPELEPIFQGGRSVQLSMQSARYKFFLTSYGDAPLLWISNDCLESYALFKRFFDALGIEEPIKGLVDYRHGIVMYCGFLVIGNRGDKERWHVDYQPGANAYTLITPLLELQGSHGRLRYKDESATVCSYPYTLGEAIILGDHFLHTTEPYERSAELRVLLSLTFGTDKLEHWNVLGRTVGGQSSFMMLPCGHQRGTCTCLASLERRRVLEQSTL